VRTPRIGHPAAASALAAAIAITSSAIPLTAVAQDGPSVTLPAAETRSADRELITADEPRIGPASFDVDAAGEAALAQVDRFTAPDWDITELADSLGPEPEAAFEFIRDHIGFDPYAGVLRGAHGTLVARSGNAWDRALLLSALLEAGGSTTRLVTADLDETATSEVLSRAMTGPIELSADPDPVGLLGLDLSALVTRARRDHALLAEGLGSELDAIGAGSTAQHPAAISRHAWVQALAPDGSWLDLDPTISTMTPGDVLVQGASELEAPPADLRHALTVRVLAETLADGALRDEIVLDERLDAAETADGEVWLSFQTEQAGIGGAVLEAAADVTWLPLLNVGGDVRAGTSFAVGGGGEASDFFFGGGDPELTGLRIELTSEAPGLEPLMGRRILLDRVAPADRATGLLVPELLGPLPPAGEVLPALAGVHQVLLSNGASDPRAWATRRAIALGWGADLQHDSALADEFGLHDVLFPLATANQVLVLASEQLLTDAIGVPGEARAFVGRPRGYLVSFERQAGIADGTAIITDLAVDDIDVLVADGIPGSTAGQVRLWHGVLQSALETELALERSRAVSPETVTLGSVSLAMDGAPTLVRPDGIDTVDASAGALRRALDSGDLALVVGGPSRSFWAIDPLSGRTRSVSEPGIRNSSIGGGNYVNTSAGGPRWVVDPKTGNSLGTIRNGRFTPARRPPPSRCSGGTEYVILLGCVSLPASMTAGMATNVIVTAGVSWGIVVLELIYL